LYIKIKIPPNTTQILSLKFVLQCHGTPNMTLIYISHHLHNTHVKITFYSHTTGFKSWYWT